MNRLQELDSRIDSREARIGVIGLGYVGLPLAVEFVRAGFDVTGLEIDTEKVRLLEEEDLGARGRLAATELGLVPPSLDDALRELLNPGDPWVAACALAAIRTEQGGPLPEGLRRDLLATGYQPLLELLDADNPSD